MYVVVLRNGPLLGRCYCLTGPYLLLICPTCLVIALEPRRAQVLPLLPPLALACAASVSCVMGHGEWLCCCCICCCCSPEAKKIGCVPPAQAPMLPLLLLPFSPSCCLCCGCLCCVAALPSWWSCCSSCCLSCAHHPMFLFERNIVLRNTNGCSACSLFKQKALH